MTNEMHKSMQRVYEVTKLTQTELARALNVSPQNVHNWEKRGASKKALILILSKFNLNPSWIENGVGEYGELKNLNQNYENCETLSTSSVRLVPVKFQIQSESDGFYKTMILEGKKNYGYVPAIEVSDASFATKITNDLFYPAIRSGWYIVCDPLMAPVQTELVEVVFKNGKKTVQEFIGIIDDSIHLLNVSGSNRSTFDMSEIESITAITDIVPPSKLVKMGNKDSLN